MFVSSFVFAVPNSIVALWSIGVTWFKTTLSGVIWVDELKITLSCRIFLIFLEGLLCKMARNKQSSVWKGACDCFFLLYLLPLRWHLDARGRYVGPLYEELHACFCNPPQNWDRMGNLAWWCIWCACSLHLWCTVTLLWGLHLHSCSHQCTPLWCSGWPLQRGVRNGWRMLWQDQLFWGRLLFDWHNLILIILNSKNQQIKAGKCCRSSCGTFYSNSSGSPVQRLSNIVCTTWQ